MKGKRVILDADVIIHFAKGDMLSLLPIILKEYEHIILDKVYDEIKGQIKTQLDNQIQLLRNIQKVVFNPSGEQLREYASLKNRFGSGESACMAYCRFNKDIIGSSNLRDISDYCNTHDIEYHTTIDFLKFAIERGIITTDDANEFVQKVINNGSKLPNITF